MKSSSNWSPSAGPGGRQCAQNGPRQTQGQCSGPARGETWREGRQERAGHASQRPTRTSCWPAARHCTSAATVVQWRTADWPQTGRQQPAACSLQTSTGATASEWPFGVGGSGPNVQGRRACVRWRRARPNGWRPCGSVHLSRVDLIALEEAERSDRAADRHRRSHPAARTAQVPKALPGLSWGARLAAEQPAAVVAALWPFFGPDWSAKWSQKGHSRGSLGCEWSGPVWSGHTPSGAAHAAAQRSPQADNCLRPDNCPLWPRSQSSREANSRPNQPKRPNWSNWCLSFRDGSELLSRGR